MYLIPAQSSEFVEISAILNWMDQETSLIPIYLANMHVYLVFLFGNVVEREWQQEVLGPHKESAPLFIQQQGAEAAGPLQLEPPHSVELLQF